MLSSESQNQAQDSQPPGLLQPVLGQANQQEFIHFSGEFKSLLSNRTVTLNLYQDRVVALTETSSQFFLLEGETVFQSKFGSKEVKFESRETGHLQIFETENLIELEAFCDKLKPLCPQKKFSEKYSLLEVIGGSAHSKVFKAHSNIDGNYYAVKKCQYGKAISKEIQMLRQLRHPNLIFFHEYFIEEGHDTYLILDYCDGGNLLHLIQSNEFSPKLKHQLIKDILNGLEYLRIKGIVHRDLKPENILYSKTYGTFTIADFGVAVWQNEMQEKIVGTPGYIAPEMFKISKSNPLPARISSDLYAAGLIIYEALTTKRFFEGTSEQALMKANLKGNSFKSWEDDLIHKYEANILRKMIRRDPKDRKNSYEIMKSEYMSKLNMLNGIDLKSVSTESPKKRSSESSEKDDENLFNAVKNLLKMRSSSY